jgi:hypothetical protein
MVQRGYKHGHKCWEDFMKLLLDADTKKLDSVQSTLQFKPTLLNHKEEDVDDQNLDGFEFDSEESSKQKAVERQSMLENLANQLGDLFGERPIVPMWARAESTCPAYYS